MQGTSNRNSRSEPNKNMTEDEKRFVTAFQIARARAINRAKKAQKKD